MDVEDLIGSNAFAGVKRYGAVSAVYRNRRPDFDDHLMLTATGLWNYYLMAANPLIKTEDITALA